MNKRLITYILLTIISVNCIIGCNDMKNYIITHNQIDSKLVNKIKESQINNFTRLIYASEDKVIFYGVEGLIIYDLNDKKITNVVDLKSIGMNIIQSDEVTIFKISNDGNKILMYNENHTNESNIYDTKDSSLKKTDITKLENEYKFEPISDENILLEGDREYSYIVLPINTDKICYLSFPQGVQKGIQDLKIVILNQKTNEETIYNVFE